MTSEAVETGSELEAGLLAACWEDDKNTELVLGYLTEKDFASEVGRQQFRALRKTWQTYRVCEAPSLKKVSADAGNLDSWHFVSEAFASGRWAGYGPGYLSKLMQQVRDGSARVRVSRALNSARQVLADPDKGLAEAVGEISHLLTEATAQSLRHNAESWKAGLGALLDRINRDLEAEVLGLPATGQVLATGLDEFDRVLGGFGESELIVLAARPRVGKTAFALQVATHIAATEGPVLFLSLELSREKIWARVAVQQSGYPLDVIKRRPDLVERARQREARLWIDDTPLRPEQLQQRIELFRLEHPDLKAVFVDHLGILAGDGADYKATSLASNICRRAMKATGLPLVVLVQISRKAEDRNGGRPGLADLKMSGCIEEDARKVVLLHRPPLYVRGGDPWEAVAIVAKNGEGEEGDVPLRYNGPLFTFLPGSGQKVDRSVERIPGKDFPVVGNVQFVDIPEDMF